MAMTMTMTTKTATSNGALDRVDSSTDSVREDSVVVPSLVMPVSASPTPRAPPGVAASSVGTGSPVAGGCAETGADPDESGDGVSDGDDADWLDPVAVVGGVWAGAKVDRNADCAQRTSVPLASPCPLPGNVALYVWTIGK
jgi:hypothetical protein